MKQNRLLLYLFSLLSLPVWAGGRLAGSGGVTQLEGAGGGGLVPWALVAGTGTRDQVGVSGFATRVVTQKFALNSIGINVDWHNRLEFSYARQTFDLDKIIPNESLSQDIVGLKWRLYGDAVIDQDRLLPQLALGAQYKHNRVFDVIPKALGGKRGQDVDWYAAATKIWLDGLFGRTSLLNATLRYTRANQLGLLGFGGDNKDDRCWCLETSAALFLNDRWVLGAEYRQKPDNLAAAREDAFYDAFVAWIPNKQLALTMAYANLGSVANQTGQSGWYLSLQGGF